MNEQKYLFSEDARKHRKPMLVFTVFFYICFLGLLANTIASFFESEIDWALSTGLILISALALFVAVYYTWGLMSKYLKYYMFITETDMEFYANNESHRYRIDELKDYEIVSTRTTYTNYKLFFTDGKAFLISSFQVARFQEALSRIIRK
ncbi:MAG: hypothetical protein LBR37_00435 [Erysipelotrichaceae bacterium]|jgi:hypothetical protein|nr:hypothetical protein [Erysipelotrichaceae bacterium]